MHEFTQPLFHYQQDPTKGQFLRSAGLNWSFFLLDRKSNKAYEPVYQVFLIQIICIQLYDLKYSYLI